MNKNTMVNYIISPLENLLLLIRNLGVDKYVKKLTLKKFVTLMIYAQICEQDSLRALSTSVSNSKLLKKTVSIDSISYSQLSRKLRETKPEHLNELFLYLIQEIQKGLNIKKNDSNLDKLCLIDSSTISMSISQYPWATFRKTKSGIKLHQRLIFHKGEVYPDKAIVTNARPADKNKMDDLVSTDPDVIYVFDRAYVDYKKFDDYCENEINFVTRLKSNAKYEVCEEKTVSEGSVIIKDEIVILGNSVNKMKSKVRIIETVDLEDKVLIILTSIFDKTAEEIADIYRHRWKIELFFKWMKQHMKIKVFYGKSSAAVENQIFMALITYCLLKLLELKEKYEGTMLKLLRIVKVNILETYQTFKKLLHMKSSKTSTGRKKIDVMESFNKILKDYELDLTSEYSAY